MAATIPNIAPDYKRIGAVLREARERLGMEQKEAARLLHRDKSSLSKIEQGKANTSLEFLQRYGALVGVEITMISDQAERLQERLAYRLQQLDDLDGSILRTLDGMIAAWEGDQSRTRSQAG